MPSDGLSLSARLSQRCVAAVLRQPWLVLGIMALLVTASVALSLNRLQYKTQRDDLLGADKDCQRRWQHYVDAFGADDDFVFVIRGDNQDRMAAAADAIAEKLRREPEHFDRIFHVVDLRSLYSRSLQYLSPAELKDIESRLEDLSPLLGPLSQVGWHALSLESILSRAAMAKEPTNSADRRLLAELPTLLKAATQYMNDPGSNVSAWSGGGGDDSMLSQPHHFFTPDGRLALVMARPRTVADSLTSAQEACATARALLAETRREFPGLEFGLTGLPVLETDEMTASDEDSRRANYLALGGVIVLYVLVYRGFRYPFLTVSTLVVGTLLALGWATLTIGHLNILSAAFAVMLIGLGDYGVIWVAHYDEQRRLGLSVHDALLHSAAHAGPGIITASFTAALAFAATMLADFQAVAELGWIAGWGVLFCLVACFTVLPALIAIGDRFRNPSRTRNILPFPGPERAFLPGLSAQPRTVLAVGAAVLIALTFGIAHVRYDANLLDMQAAGLDSVKWEEELISHSAGMTWDALSLAGSREEALRLKAKYEAVPGVGRVVEAASLVPVEYEAKRATLAAIHRKLGGLPATVPDFSLDTAEAAVALSGHVPTAESRAFREALSALPRDVATARLRAFDAKLRRDLHADLQRLHAVSQPERIALDDLPAAFRERYVAPNGTFLVRAFANESLWDYAALERFTQAAETADPNATGKSFRTLEGLRQMKAGFLRAGVAALAVIVVVLWFDFRSPRMVLLGLLPLLLGMIATVGVMGWWDLPFNPANMIALPLIIGAGLDYGMHVLHDYLRKAGTGRYRLAFPTGRGIFIKALTTILGFGTLMTARHRGMASLGLTLTLGVTACMAAALVVLPAVLRFVPVQAQVRILSMRMKRQPERVAA